LIRKREQTRPQCQQVSGEVPAVHGGNVLRRQGLWLPIETGKDVGEKGLWRKVADVEAEIRGNGAHGSGLSRARNRLGGKLGWLGETAPARVADLDPALDSICVGDAGVAPDRVEQHYDVGFRRDRRLHHEAAPRL